MDRQPLTRARIGDRVFIPDTEGHTQNGDSGGYWATVTGHRASGEHPDHFRLITDNGIEFALHEDTPVYFDD